MSRNTSLLLALAALCCAACAPSLPRDAAPEGEAPEEGALAADSALEKGSATRERVAWQLSFLWVRTGDGAGRVELRESEPIRGLFALPRRLPDPPAFDGFWQWEASDASGKPLFRDSFPHPGVLHADFDEGDGELSGGTLLQDSATFTIVVPSPDREGNSSLYVSLSARENGIIRDMGRWQIRQNRDDAP